MHKLLLVLLFSISLDTYSQELIGTISDRSNLHAIPYTSIYYKNANVGTYADTNGNFSIRKLLNDTLIISAIGYEKQTYPIIHNSTSTINFSLVPSTIKLNEVMISAQKKLHKTSGKKLRIGNLSSKQDIHVSGFKSHTIAYLVENPSNIQAQIKTIHYNIGSKISQPNEALIRPQLYSIDFQTGKPGEALLLNPEVISVLKGNKQLVVEINHLGIQLPSDGIYIALEWIGSSTWYTLSKTKKPTTVYMKFMDKGWQIRPTKRVSTKKGLGKKELSKEEANKTYYEEPNFSITVLSN